MRVILVTHDSVFSRYLANGLYEAGMLDRVIVERSHASWRFYWRKLKRVGPLNAVFQTLLNRWFRKEGQRHLPRVAMPPHDNVANINGFAFGADDLVVGFGTSFISATTLNATPRGFLNLHTGWLPGYRGVKSEFWTLALNDRHNAGWTLHYMTPKLDDGDIVLQQRVETANAVSAPGLRAALLRDAVPAIAEFINGVRRNGFEHIERHPQQAGTYFTTPTWREWLRYRSRVTAP